MAHIVDTLAKHFTGHVGPVPFKNGHAECADPDLIEFFESQPDRYVVERPELEQAPLESHEDEQDPDDTEE